MKKLLAIASLLLLCGCLDRADEPTPPPSCEPSCEPAIPSGPSSISLSSCVESRFPLELDRVVYEVPDGFETAGSTTSPQRVYVALASCEGGKLDNETLGPFSLGQIGVFVDAPERGQGGNADIYTLEIVTDSNLLREAFMLSGYPTINGSISMSDQEAIRQATVSGEAHYDVQAAFPPIGNGPVLGSPPIAGSVAQHSLETWYQDDRTCYQYFGTALVTLTATEGVLQQAMPSNRPLHGSASMSFACDSEIHFGNATIDSA